VVCDVVMDGGDGLNVLEHVHRLPQPKPRIVLATAYGNTSDRELAKQLGAAGYLSKPTWRILLYSADEPPSQRGLVLVDGQDGDIIDWIVEDNPEDWSEFAASAD
ncbi:MAG: response regulator, partial [Acidimicrobiales bacterium]